LARDFSQSNAIEVAMRRRQDCRDDYFASKILHGDMIAKALSSLDLF